MPDFQPKIYSLSTLNIRQHFNCDYRFHQFRTDFSGESGSGKSLIADFIQLLLVGSAVFKSGTEGVKQRDTSGLVIKGASGKYGRGYILINVELQPKRYIALGGYLESSSSQMQFFIVQAGYDFDELLQPMKEPIFFRDLLVCGKIETLDILQKQFLDKGYLKSLNNKKYHQLLFANGILSIDLSQSRQSLKSFGAIIRSFSRGKGFFTDSDALKTFLFGDDDQKQLMEKYRDEVQNISLDQQQHQRLLDEIGTIRSKEDKIAKVLSSYKTFQEQRLRFSKENASFWYERKENAQTGIDQAIKMLKSAFISRLLVSKKIVKMNLDDIDLKRHRFNELEFKIRTSGSEGLRLSEQYSQAKRLLEGKAESKKMIDSVSEWISNMDGDSELLRKKYVLARQKRKDQELLREFELFLTENQIVVDFQQSFWFSDFSRARVLALGELESLNNGIKKMEIQLAFSDFDNPNSLANWALDNLVLPLSLELESLLVHFQALSRSEPAIVDGKERYLPFPERLFDAPSIVPAGSIGFWVELKGVYEFVEFVSEQYLDKPMAEIERSELSLNSLKEKLAQEKHAAASLKTLWSKLEGFSGLERAVFLYREDRGELFDKEEEFAELLPGEFERYMDAFNSREDFLESYLTYQEAYALAFENLNAHQYAGNDLLEKRSEVTAYMNRQFGSNDFELLISENGDSLAVLEAEFEELLSSGEQVVREVQKIEGELFLHPPSLSKLHELSLSTEKAHELAQRDVLEKTKYIELSGKKMDDARLAFFADHCRDFDPKEDLIGVSIEPNGRLSDEAGSEFRANYKLASEGIEDKTILADFSIGVLANKLLPTVFPTQQIQEELIGEQIERRLLDLTNDLQQIGSRKIEILHNVFNEVQKTYNGYLTKVQKIGNYLRSKNRQITGGNHATLEPRPAVGYPDEWMKVFRKRLNNELQHTGIFAPNNKQDIDEIMISVFRDEGGSREATVQDLLNPRSYFDLLFDIKLDDGESNAGSNGQTYTANALLCLARLSLIEDNTRLGIRVMPIDEAEGLGSNYEMLHILAKNENYQLVTMSIETAGDISGEGQYIYIMNDNKDADKSSYVPPMGIFNNGPVTSKIHEIFEQSQ